MPDLSGIGFFPIGMALAFAMFVAHRLRHRERREATSGVAVLAQRLGLEHRPGVPGQAGLMLGFYRGYQVRVDPDEQCVVGLAFATEPAIDLRSFEGTIRKNSGLSPFYSRSKLFDRLFKHSYVEVELAERLLGYDLEALAVPFVKTWYRSVVRLTVNGSGIECRVRFGTPPYMPLKAMEELLDAVVNLAQAVEEPASALDSARPPRERPKAAAESPRTDQTPGTA